MQATAGRWVVLLAFAGALTSSGPARAAEIEKEPRVAVLSLRDPQGATNDRTVRTREALEASLRKHRVVQVGGSDRVVRAGDGPGATTGSAKDLARAHKLRRDGIARYKKFDSKGAEKRLRRAAELYEANAGALRSPEELVSTYLTLAEVFIATDREVLARDVFKRVVQLDPDRALDVTSAPPRMVRVYKDVKREVLDTPLGTLRIESTPTGGTVFLDGRQRGKTPLTLRNIPTGVHVVTIRRVGWAPFVRPVEITSFRQERVDAALQVDFHPHTQEAATAEPPSDVVEYLTAAAQAAELDVILVGVLDGETLRVRGWHGDQPLAKTYEAPVPADVPIAFDGLVAELLADAARQGWIDPLASRRRVAFGGGALDETRRMRIQASVGTGGTLVDDDTNVPIAVVTTVRITFLRRWRTRWLWAVESGVETLYDRTVELKDGNGNVVVPESDGLKMGYTSIPLNAGVRYYFGVRTLAPYVQAGLGVHYSRFYFRENLPYDEFSSKGSLGGQVHAAVGLDWALSTDDGIYADLRWQLGSLGAGDIRHDVTTGTVAPQNYPVHPGATVGLRFGIGYLRVF